MLLLGCYKISHFAVPSDNKLLVCSLDSTNTHLLIRTLLKLYLTVKKT